MRRLISIVLRLGFITGLGLAVKKILELRHRPADDEPEVGEAWTFSNITEAGSSNGAADQAFATSTAEEMPPTQTSAPKVDPVPSGEATTSPSPAQTAAKKVEGGDESAIKKAAQAAKDASAHKVDAGEKAVGKKAEPPKKAPKKSTSNKTKTTKRSEPPGE